jgi:hypothetical protein
MIKVKVNQLSLNDVLYDAGDIYACHHELKKIVIKHLELNDAGIVINNYYRLFYNANEDYYFKNNLFFSEKKATNVVNEYIKQQNRRKEKYAKEKEIEEKYKQQIIDNKLEEKYVGKPIMINRGKDGWVKTKGKEVYATDSGIYLNVDFYGHICKLSREGKTWKMWSELEELETQKQMLEKRINELKELEESK